MEKSGTFEDLQCHQPELEEHSKKKKRISFECELDQRFTIRLDLQTSGQLRDYASSEGFTPSLLIRHLVKRFLDNQRKFKIDPLKGIPL